MPIHWKEVKATPKPERFAIHTGPALLEKSMAWADHEHAAKSLFGAIEKVISRS